MEMNVGGAHLTPVSGNDTLKEYTCSSCNRMSLSVSVCCNQHILCRICCIAEQWPSKLIWCLLCRQTLTASEAKCSTTTIAGLQFKCACGFTGTLVDIRRHLLQQSTASEGQSACGTHIDTTQTLNTANGIKDLDDRIRNLASEEMRKMKQIIVEEIIQRLNKSRTSAHTEVNDHSNNMKKMLEQKMEQQKDELVKKIETQKTDFLSTVQKKIGSAIENIKQLEQTVSSHKEMIMECKQNFANKTPVTASASTAYLWFNFEAIFRRFKRIRSKICSPIQSTIIAGIQLEINIQLCTEANEDYLGIYAGLTKGSANDTPVPLHRAFTLKVHDINGADAATIVYTSLSDGKYYFACGSSSHSDQRSNGNPKMITVNSIREKKCLVGEMICVSVAVSPME